MDALDKHRQALARSLPSRVEIRPAKPPKKG